MLEVERDGAGEPVFTLYTKEPNNSSTAVVARQAATSIAVADRLGRLGISGADQAGIFAPPEVTLRSPDPSQAAASTEAAAQEIADTTVIVALEMFLLLALMFYGTWIAQGVVEEKSSRMMEIILAAATPFQLLAGKVIGVSGAAFLQFGAALVAAVVAVLGQGQVAALVFGDAAGISLPSGLTPSILVAFAVFFVLGFLLYAVLFAAAGSLVSRQEDVSQIVAPMTLVVCGAYLVALYASLGSIDIHALVGCRALVGAVPVTVPDALPHHCSHSRPARGRTRGSPPGSDDRRDDLGRCPDLRRGRPDVRAEAQPAGRVAGPG